MKGFIDESNHGIYQLVRANILAAVKGSYFIDSPNHVVRKIDRFFTHDHLADQHVFMNRLIDVLDEMQKEYYYEIGEYDRIRQSIETLKKYLYHKLQND